MNGTPSNPPGSPQVATSVAAPAAKAAVRPAPAAPAVPPAPPPPPPPLPTPEALVSLKVPFLGTDFALKGFHADATVPAAEVLAATAQMDAAGFSLDTITGVDWLAQQQMEVVYDYFHPLSGLRAVIRTRLPRENPEVATISHIFPGANWHERETHDFFGIRFTGHPDLTPFLLPEDATYHPLRKDFTS